MLGVPGSVLLGAAASQGQGQKKQTFGAGVGRGVPGQPPSAMPLVNKSVPPANAITANISDPVLGGLQNRLNDANAAHLLTSALQQVRACVFQT